MRRLRAPWARPVVVPAAELTVAEVLRRRLEGGRDDATLALVVEGGGMRGVISAAMAAGVDMPVVDAVCRLLDGAPREDAGPTTAPHGLFLAGIGYPDEVGGPAVAPADWGAPPWGW